MARSSYPPASYPPAEPDGRLYFPATARNRDAILGLFEKIMPKGARTLLEVAAGSGQHATFLAPHFSNLDWLPTDLDPANLKSIDAWRNHLDVKERVRPAHKLDVTVHPWPLPQSHACPDVIIVANLLHITPASVSESLFEGAGTRLSKNGQMFIYGPFMENGVHTSESNALFDARLKEKDPTFGVRDTTWLTELADKNGLNLSAAHTMPANNHVLSFIKNQ